MVGGRYDILDSGFCQRVAHLLSGGIYDTYETTQSTTSTPGHPDDSELFLILVQAFEHNNLITCDASKNNERNGIHNGHEYSITDVKTIRETRILKVHDPHNTTNHTIRK